MSISEIILKNNLQKTHHHVSRFYGIYNVVRKCDPDN